MKSDCSIGLDRKSTRLNSSHLVISYAVFCLKKTKELVTPLSNGCRSLIGYKADQRTRVGRRATAVERVVPRRARSSRCWLCFFFFFLMGGPPRTPPLSPHRPLSR